MTRQLRRAGCLSVLVGGAAITMLLLLGLLFGGGADLGRGGGSVSRSDVTRYIQQGGEIYFNVNVGDESYLKATGLWSYAEDRLKLAQPFVIAANTHHGTVRDLDLTGKVFLEVDGLRYPAVETPIQHATHHNTYLALVPRYDMYGQPIFDRTSGTFDLIIADVEMPERIFTFNFPVPATSGAGTSPAVKVMVMASALAALTLACTPCLLGGLTVGSLTMATGSGVAAPAHLARIRRQMISGTIYLLFSLSVAYLLMAIVSNAFNITADRLRPVELLGGVVLLGVGIHYLRPWPPVGRLVDKAGRLARRIWPWRRGGAAAPDGDTFDAGDATVVGASLAVVCSVAGAPTLNAAVILPLMVFAGMTEFYWSLLLLGIYLLVFAVPFFLIAVGLGEALLKASLRLRRTMMLANGWLLVGLGLLLLVSQERTAEFVAIPAATLIHLLDPLVALLRN